MPALHAHWTRYARLLVHLGHWHPLAVLAGGVLIIRLVDELIGLPGRLLPELALGGPQSAIAAMGIGRALFEVAMVGPAMETALFQALPIWILRAWTRLPMIGLPVVSAAIFGATHLHYNLLYGVSAAAVGWILASVYLARLRGDGWAFGLTFGIHAIHNGAEVLFQQW